MSMKALIKSIPFLLLSLTLFFSHFPSVQVLATSKSVTELNFDYNEIVNMVNITAIADHIRFFESLGTRATGSLGCEAAAQYIYERFMEYGLENVSYHFYNVTVPVDYGANITVISREKMVVLTAYPLRPNLVAPVTTPPEGISGRLIYAGEGEFSDFDGKDVEGSIVLMEYNSLCRWINAMQLGARAVIFIAPVDTTRVESDLKYLQNVPVSFPRLYISYSDGQVLRNLLRNEEVNVTIRSHVEWRTLQAKNVLGVVRGKVHPDRYIMLTAYYDSMSVVPSVAPGASEAIGVSTLLELARLFQDHPPMYSIMFIAFSGHHQALAGSRHFVEDRLIVKGGVPEEYWEDWGLKWMLQVNLQLNTGSEWVAPVWVGGQFGAIQVHKYGKIDKYMEAIKSEVERQTGIEFFLDTTVMEPQPWYHGTFRVETYYKITARDNEPLSGAYGNGISFITAYSEPKYYTTPLDTLDRISLRNLEKQLKLIYSFIFTFANTPNLVPEYLPEWDGGRGVENNYEAFVTVVGTVAAYNSSKNWFDPVPNAIVCLRKYTAGSGIGASEAFWAFTETDRNGHFKYVGWQLGSSAMYAFVINASTGEIIYAPDFGVHQQAGPDLNINQEYKDIGLYAVFESASMILTTLTGLQPPLVRDFHEQAPVESFSNLREWIGGFVGEEIWYGYDVWQIFVPPNMDLEFLFGGIGGIPLINNPSEEYPHGRGYRLSVGEQLITPHIELKLGESAYQLTGEILSLLHMQGVQTLTDEKHLQVKQLIAQAHEDLQNKEWSRFYSYAWHIYARALSNFQDVKSEALDIAGVVPFLGAFLIPFSLLFERLVINTTGKRRFIALLCICSAFLGVLSIVHPALMIATNLTVVMLGFGILMLSFFVFLLVLFHLFGLLKIIRRRTKGLHITESERLSFIVISFSIGIENMRRRPQRSLLTIVTIIIITMCLVSFTSFARMTYFISIPVEGTPAYQGIFIKQVNWGGGLKGISEGVVNYLTAQYGDKATVCPRVWLMKSHKPTDEAIFVTYEGSPGYKYSTYAALGLAPEETEVTGLDMFLVDGRWFTPYDQWSCIISQEMANALGIPTPLSIHKPKIVWSGINFTVVGILNDESFNNYLDLDGEQITPITFKVPTAVGTLKVHMSVAEVIIVPSETALQLGGRIQGIAVGFTDKNLIADVAEKIFFNFGLRAYYTIEDKIFLYSTKSFRTVMGWEFQIVPLILGALVPLQVALASIYERKKDIGIYSSLGISPTHSSIMFLSENLVYAVIGGIIGYISGITFMRLGLLIFPEIVNVNFSSGGVLTAIGAVMLAVTISTIYPTIIAAKMVTPSLERRWKIPTKPIGDTWSVPLPFKAKDDKEVLGLLAFIREFVEAHASMASETFVAEDVKYKERREKDKMIWTLSFRTRLFPFEAGILQRTEFNVIKDIIKGIYSFEVSIKREQGQTAQWETSNIRLLDELRKQLLIWKSIKAKERAEYRERATKIRPSTP